MVLNASAHMIFGTRWAVMSPHYSKTSFTGYASRNTSSTRDAGLHSAPSMILLVQTTYQWSYCIGPCSPTVASSFVPPIRSCWRPPPKIVKFGKRTVTQGNTIVWNSLPGTVTNATSLESFPTRLKTRLFGLI